MNFDWSKSCGEFPADRMDRAIHAEHLTRFLVQKGEDGNYVLNLNAAWGSGKSYFIQRWVKEIEKVYPTVYIDAWSSDHSDDPLLSVVSAIKQKMDDLKGISEFESNLYEGVAKTVKAAAPAVVKALLKGQIKRWTGLSEDDICEIMSNDDLADTGARLVEHAISAHNDAKAGVKEIKASIINWLRYIVDSENRKYPLFIFIDELDRCRPTYAIEMLETIKHIFDIQNVIFIVATDRSQLQHSINAIYGIGFNSRLYLDRFFSRTVTLKSASTREFITSRIEHSTIYTKYFQEEDNFPFLPSDNGRLIDAVEFMSELADRLNMPLRTVNLWLDRIEAAISMSKIRLELTLLSFIMALETHTPEDFSLFEKGIDLFDPHVHKSSHLTSPFPVKITWRLTETLKSNPQISIDSQHYYAKNIKSEKINCRELINNFRKILQSSENDLVASVKKEITEASLNGGNFKKTNLVTGTNYTTIIFYIYGLFHIKNNIKISHYFDMCKYSSLLN